MIRNSLTLKSLLEVLAKAGQKMPLGTVTWWKLLLNFWLFKPVEALSSGQLTENMLGKVRNLSKRLQLANCRKKVKKKRIKKSKLCWQAKQNLRFFAKAEETRVASFHYVATLARTGLSQKPTLELWKATSGYAWVNLETHVLYRC